MKKYTDIEDLDNLNTTISEAIRLKKDPFQFSGLGKNKMLVMLFFNSSLRTRLSTEKAAKNLGMDVMVLNVTESWNIEFEDEAVMNFSTSEHIKEAALVISQYADIIAVRAFASLKNKEKDVSEHVLQSFVKYATVPVINMESATSHPLQALTDAITIQELESKPNPKVVLSWAPHPKALPHAVANSFIKIMKKLDVDLTITHPLGYELDTKITEYIPIVYDQKEALENADFVYVKNWSSYTNYGKIISEDPKWMVTKDKLKEAKFMHCLPVRRNVVVEDSVLDSENSVVIPQANNRTYAAQVILKNMLENLES